MNAHQDPGTDPANEWARLSALPEDAAVTPEEYRIAAKVLRANGHPSNAEYWEKTADRLDREAARDAFVEGLVRSWWETYRDTYCAIKPGASVPEWDDLMKADNGPALMAAHTAAACTAIDHLQPFAEWLIAEKAWKVALALPTELPGLGRKYCGVEDEIGHDCNLRTGHDGMHESFDHLGNVHRKWDAEKPAPREWPSLDKVPDGVVVRGRGGYPEYTAGQVDHPERTTHEGPFTEVSA